MTLLRLVFGGLVCLVRGHDLDPNVSPKNLLGRVCCRCPVRVYPGPVVDVISSGPPNRTLGDILRNPPRLKLKPPKGRP